MPLGKSYCRSDKQNSEWQGRAACRVCSQGDSSPTFSPLESLRRYCQLLFLKCGPWPSLETVTQMPANSPPPRTASEVTPPVFSSQLFHVRPTSSIRLDCQCLEEPPRFPPNSTGATRLHSDKDCNKQPAAAKTT